MISAQEFLLYARQHSLPDIGFKGQQQLKQSKVLCVGAGGLGCPALLYLAAMGIGTIGVIDDDIVDFSNLQRQVLYTIEDVDLKKVDVAKRELNKHNPNVEIITYDMQLTTNNALEIIKHYDLVLDCSDNFATRYLVNDACFSLKKPYIFAAYYSLIL